MGAVALAAFVLAITALHFAHGAGELLQFERGRFEAGEVWRLVTCHFVHWNASHLVWDAAAVAVLGRLAVRADPRRAAAAVLLAMIAIPLAVYWLQPELRTYLGLSGVAAGLFVFVGCRLLRQWHQAGMLAVTSVVVALALFAGKILYEQVTGTTLFAAADGDFVPVPLAHLVGGMAGCVCAVTRLHWGRNAACAIFARRPALGGAANLLWPARQNRSGFDV